MQTCGAPEGVAKGRQQWSMTKRLYDMSEPYENTKCSICVMYLATFSVIIR